MESIVRSLLLGCIVVQLTWLTGGSTPDDKKTADNYSRTIYLPSNYLRNPILKIHMYQGFEISPVETQLTMEGDGGEKLRDQQASIRVPVEEIGDGDHRERNYVRVAQGEISRTDERNSPEKTKVDLSFLDNLAGLAPYLPDVGDSKEVPSDAEWYSILFKWFLSRLLGTTKATTVDGRTIVRETPDTLPRSKVPSDAEWYSSIFNWFLSRLLGTTRAAKATVDGTTIVRERSYSDSDHPTNPTRPKVTSASIAPSSHGNYQQPVENYLLLQKMREIINSATPPIRDAVNFNRNVTIESGKSKQNTYNETVRIHPEYSKIMHLSNVSTDAPAAG